MSYDSFDEVAVREVFDKLSRQSETDVDFLVALVDINACARTHGKSDPRQESKVILKEVGWWPLSEAIAEVLRDRVRGAYPKRGLIWQDSDAEA